MKSIGYLEEIMRKPDDSLVVRNQSFRLDWKGVRVEHLPDSEGNVITFAAVSLQEEFRRSAVLVTFSIN